MEINTAVEEIYNTLIKHGFDHEQIRKLYMGYRDIALRELGNKKEIRKHLGKFSNPETLGLEYSNNAMEQLYEGLTNAGKTEDEAQEMLTRLCTELLLDLYDHEFGTLGS